jgi:putative FmdB family regulatory protein
MILYEYECRVCGKIFERYNSIETRHTAQCPNNCQGVAELVITNHRNQDWFKPGMWEDFGLEPVFVRSKGHLKELCLQHGMYSKALGPIDDKRGC